ncbi:MAG TPA: hypothetical protein VK139_04290 [Microbacteriaceae bacterium]|nr:hypothetical protein [Microbacteriaceae bacterium]
MAPHLSTELAAEWLRVLRDIAPTEVMRTVERVKPALPAHWLARAVDEEAARAYAERWHAAGWSPEDWWRLASACTLEDLRASVKEHRDVSSDRTGASQSDSVAWRECGRTLRPAEWTQWRELAAEVGPIRATRALLDDRNLPLDTRLFWAGHEVKVTAPRPGLPGTGSLLERNEMSRLDDAPSDRGEGDVGGSGYGAQP